MLHEICLFSLVLCFPRAHQPLTDKRGIERFSVHMVRTSLSFLTTSLACFLLTSSQTNSVYLSMHVMKVEFAFYPQVSFPFLSTTLNTSYQILFCLFQYRP